MSFDFLESLIPIAPIDRMSNCKLTQIIRADWSEPYHHPFWDELQDAADDELNWRQHFEIWIDD